MQARTYVAPDDVFKGDVDEIHERLDQIIKVFQHFRKIYDRTSARIAEHTSRNGSIPPQWDFPSSLVFARADVFLLRVENIKVMDFKNFSLNLKFCEIATAVSPSA